MKKSSSGEKKGPPTLKAEAVRTVKILGSSVQQSSIEQGYVATRGLETVCTSAGDDDIKIAVYACGFEASTTEAKGTVLMKTAEDLLTYNKTEEAKMEEIVSSIAATGVKMVVTGGNLSDMALHFLDKHNMICLKISSKWELRRLCQAVNATALVRLGPPMPDEMGHARSVQQKEIGSRPVTVIDAGKDSKLATIVLRASTSSMLADLERACTDAVQAVVQASRDGRMVAGGGAVEMALAVALQRESEKVPGLEQYALSAFGKALQVIPRQLADNAGWDANRVLADLQAAHAKHHDNSDKTPCDVGVDIDLPDSGSTASNEGGTKSMKDSGVLDLLQPKLSALQLAVDAAVTILKVDQIIMSKPAGIKPPGQ